MKIDISHQEFLDLLDILHIADIVMTGHRRQPDERSARHRALVQKLYGLSRGEGMEHLMGYHEGTKRYVPTAEFEQSSVSHPLVDEFGEHVFWDELIGKLSVRDAARQAGGMPRLNALSENDRQALEAPIRQRYIAEFTSHGIETLAIVQRFDDTGGMTPVPTSD